MLNGKESEKTTTAKGKNNEKNKRKRNRNRKKNASKVENLVSKTFQAKLVANLTQSENTIIDGKATLKVDVSDQSCLRTVASTNSTVGSPLKDILSSSSFISEGVATTDKEKPHLMKNTTVMVQTTVGGPASTEKSREDILAEREAKKLAKQQAKQKNKDGSSKSIAPLLNVNAVRANHIPNDSEIPKHGNKKEIEKPSKQKSKVVSTSTANIASVTKKVSGLDVSEGADHGGAKDNRAAFTKAERRAIQEAQRAAKADAVLTKPVSKSMNSLVYDKKTTGQRKEEVAGRNEKSPITKTKDCKVKLFNHLENCRTDLNLFINNSHIHPIIVKLGEQYSKRNIVGSNARCISFLSAVKTVIEDYETPARKEFARSLEATIKIAVDHLHKCRPLAVSVWNAYKHIKHVLTQLSVDQPEPELKEHLCHFVDTYIENQIGKAAEAISRSVQNKISNGDVILTFGCSSLINYILEEAYRRHVDFRVIVVDSRPFSEGQELLRRLSAKEIPCTYVLINAVGFIMPEVTKILLGAHALLSNGYVMARTGTAQVALVARSFNVPVLVCCETHKFSERFQTDAIVYNELGNPDDLIMNDKCRLMNWQAQNKLSPLNLNYDITPPELVTAVVTEVGILPCTSVPVILRIMPTEIGY